MTSEYVHDEATSGPICSSTRVLPPQQQQACGRRMIPARDVLAAAAMRSIKNESGRPEFTIKEIATRFLHCEPDALRKRLTNLDKSMRNSNSMNHGMFALSLPAPPSATKRRSRAQSAATASASACTAAAVAAMAAGFTVVTLPDAAAAMDTTGAMLMTEDIKEDLASPMN